MLPFGDAVKLALVFLISAVGLSVVCGGAVLLGNWLYKLAKWLEERKGVRPSVALFGPALVLYILCYSAVITVVYAVQQK